MITRVRNGMNYGIGVILFTGIVAMIKLRTYLEKYTPEEDEIQS